MISNSRHASRWLPAKKDQRRVPIPAPGSFTPIGRGRCNQARFQFVLPKAQGSFIGLVCEQPAQVSGLLSGHTAMLIQVDCFFSSCLRTPGLASACRRLYLTCRPCDLQLPIENSSASPKHLKFVTEKLPHAAIDHGVSQMSCSWGARFPVGPPTRGPNVGGKPRTQLRWRCAGAAAPRSAQVHVLSRCAGMVRGRS
jgi:hypothetical protein